MKRNMDRIFIKDLRVYGILGIYEQERRQPREILINISLYTDTRGAAETDNISDGIDYEKVALKVRGHVEGAARFTVEALAEDLARLCLEEPLVEKVRVCVEKPGAVHSTTSVGVEIERTRNG
jgi:FolB domain-containing protein